MKNTILLSLLVISIIFMSEQASASNVSFIDPVNDQIYVSSIDLVNVTLDFNQVTGDYTIDLTTTSANPFSGNFRVNILLFNPDTGSNQRDRSFLVDSSNDFNLAVSSTTLQLTGNYAGLVYWQNGHRVATSHIVGLGLPDSTGGFRSGVLYPPDLDYSDGWDALDTFSYIGGAPIPEPATMLLFGIGLLGLAGVSRRKQ